MTSVVDNAIDLQWQKFLSPEFGTKSHWDKVPEGNTLIFGHTHISLQYSVGQVEESPHAKTQLDSSSCSNTGL